MKPKFAAGDKVFAKIRGYPPWPARVEDLDETHNQIKYHIFFYGTGETAVVKAEDICSFVENKVRLGKPKKLKKFQEALFQIEEDLSLEEKRALKKSQTRRLNNDSGSGDPENKKRLPTRGKSYTESSAAKSAKFLASPTRKTIQHQDLKYESNEKRRPVMMNATPLIKKSRGNFSNKLQNI